MTTAPDGTPLEVIRNAGKPTRAQEIAAKLAAERAAKKANRKGKGAQQATEAATVEPAAPAPMHADDLHEVAAAIRAENAAAQATAAPAAGKESAELTEARATMAATQAAAAPHPKPATAPAKPKVPLDTKGMSPKHVVEAALFSAGKPLSVEEIHDETKLSPEAIKKAIKDLQRDYDDRDTVLEVGKAGTKWAMQVRTRAAEPAARFAPMEIAPKLLKTLALIAYHQPMKQSDLVDMIGTKVYDHVPELIERGLVKAREEGVTKILATTAQFPEYFGLDAASPDEVRAVMGKMVGITAPPRPKDWKPGQKLADLAKESAMPTTEDGGAAVAEASAAATSAPDAAGNA